MAEARVRYYPIYLSLRGETCVVAGGNEAVEAVVEEALRCGGSVIVIAPTVSERLRTWVEAGEIAWQARLATSDDAASAFITFCATGDAALDAALIAAAEANNRLATQLADQRQGNFLAPPSFRQGDLTIAVSASGRAPALERELLKKVSVDFGPEWATFLSWLGEKRAEVKAKHPSIVCRIRLWDDVVATDVLDLIRAGQLDAARARYQTTLDTWLADESVPISADCCRRCPVAAASGVNG